jgi:hypothetical protein
MSHQGFHGIKREPDLLERFYGVGGLPDRDPPVMMNLFTTRQAAG